jgi:hypothetical protein
MQQWPGRSYGDVGLPKLENRASIIAFTKISPRCLSSSIPADTGSIVGRHETASVAGCIAQFINGCPPATLRAWQKFTFEQNGKFQAARKIFDSTL